MAVNAPGEFWAVLRLAYICDMMPKNGTRGRFCLSQQAAQKLSDMGYTGIYEFGGIIDWTGEVVTESSGANEAGKEKG